MTKFYEEIDSQSEILLTCTCLSGHGILCIYILWFEIAQLVNNRSISKCLLISKILLMKLHLMNLCIWGNDGYVYAPL